MTVSKLRAAFVVFLIGFALGVSMFAASRLFVRSVLSADATAAAEQLASRLAAGEPIEGSGTSSVVRYSYFDRNGRLVKSADMGGRRVRTAPMQDAAVRRTSLLASEGVAIVVHDPLVPTLFGLAEPTVRGVAVPVVSAGATIGSVFVEVDQAASLDSLTRAFTMIGIVTMGMAVLAIVATAFALTRGRGLGGARRAFNLHALPKDRLTSLPTRDGLVEALEDAVTRAGASDAPLGLMIVDLDEFRTVNDIWGHAVADQVLKQAADRLRAFAGGPACLARISGDTFALIVDRDADTHGLRRLADRIRTALAAPYVVADSSIIVGATIGAAIFPVNAENAEVLFRAADTALSKAKTEGRNALAFFDRAMEKRMQRQAALERDLRQALERDEFVLFYQPQMELASGRVRGYEALVRWERPGEGILAPRDFLSVAEDTGLIRPLGDWVLRKACRDAVTWLDGGTVGVNFSPVQFLVPDLDKTIAAVLAETGLPAERLEIEVPESMFLRPAPELLETLTRIKALGVRVAMDNFGASYSGLSSLAHFPFDKIKIDNSFVGQLTEDADVAAIVASIVGLGRSMSVDITAECVETHEQVTLLKAAGCSIVQGFLFGMPKRDASNPAAAQEGGDAALGRTG